jgi:hypothetical protein
MNARLFLAIIVLIGLLTSHALLPAQAFASSLNPTTAEDAGGTSDTAGQSAPAQSALQASSGQVTQETTVSGSSAPAPDTTAASARSDSAADTTKEPDKSDGAQDTTIDVSARAFGDIDNINIYNDEH